MTNKQIRGTPYFFYTGFERKPEFPNPLCLLWWTSLFSIQHLVKGFLTLQAERKFSKRIIAVLLVYELIFNLQVVWVTRNAETAIHQIIINPYVHMWVQQKGWHEATTQPIWCYWNIYNTSPHYRRNLEKKGNCLVTNSMSCCFKWRWN